MGNGRVIRAGEFQYMAAGTGVQHSEFNPSKTEAAAPAANLDPAGHKRRDAALRGEKFRPKAETGKLHLVASKTGRDGSMEIHQDADLLLAKLGRGQTVTHPLAPNRHAWIHVAEGEVELNGTKLAGGDAVGVSEENVLNISATKPSQVLLFDLN